jgi:hypothetical protein
MLHGAACALDAQPLDRVRVLAQPSGIQHHNRHTLNRKGFLDEVARGAWNGGDDGALLTQQRVQQRRFAHIRSPTIATRTPRAAACPTGHAPTAAPVASGVRAVVSQRLPDPARQSPPRSRWWLPLVPAGQVGCRSAGARFGRARPHGGTARRGAGSRCGRVSGRRPPRLVPGPACRSEMPAG